MAVIRVRLRRAAAAIITSRPRSISDNVVPLVGRRAAVTANYPFPIVVLAYFLGLWSGEDMDQPGG